MADDDFMAWPTETTSDPARIIERLILVSGHDEVSGPSQSIKLRALASSVRLRWIYPCDTKVRRFMNDWQPKGRFRSWIWRVGVCASTMAYAGLIPGVAKYAIDRAAVAGLRRRFGPETADCLPVFFIGAIGYRRKMVVAWMDRQGNCAAVGKLPLGRLAAQALGDEAMAISGPASKLGIAMPALIRWDETTGFQLQSALPGRMCYEPFGERHTALLVKMVSPAPLAVETVYSGLLNSKDRRVAEQAKFLLAEHTGESVRPAIVRGDFTQSNLKNIAGNELAILDWEYYSPRGVALADAAYFQLFLGYFVRRLTGPALLDYVLRFVDNELFARLCEVATIGVSQRHCFACLGLLTIAQSRIDDGLGETDEIVSVILNIVDGMKQRGLFGN